MRRSLVLALALVACGGDAPAPDARSSEALNDDDPIVLRVPRNGGTARAAVYPVLDSIIWEASSFPALDRVLGFDPEGGGLAVVTKAGLPAHLDLRLGRATVASRDTLRSPTSINGSDIFGIDARGRVVRVSPTGGWSFTPPFAARTVYAQPDGGVVIAAARGNQTTLWRVQPPEDQILDSAFLPPVETGVATQLGDRLYFTTDTAIIAIAARTLEPAQSVRTRERVLAAAATPSGDRLYVATHGTRRLRVIARFSDAGPGEVELPDEASDLRMDPLGRYVLARSAGTDSVWIVAVGTGRLVATLSSRWTADLPAVTYDGAIATLGRRDVVFVNPESGREMLRVAGGAADFWTFIAWNGFRPRPAGLDVPVTFSSADSAPPDLIDTEGAADVAEVPSPPSGGAGPPGAPPTRDTTPAMAVASGFTVSFAAFLSQQRAASLADSIAIGQARARVVASEAGGTTLYRVVVGPYPTRADAEAAGRVSQRQYWIIEGRP